MEQKLSRETANLIFDDVLVSICGYNDDTNGSNRGNFVFHQTSCYCPEYYFGGDLKYGKFWNNNNSFYITSGSVHEGRTTKEDIIIAKANKRLDEIYLNHSVHL